MNIYHHHIIHVCPTCSSDHAGREAAPTETETSRSWSSIVTPLAAIVRYATMLALSRAIGSTKAPIARAAEPEVMPPTAQPPAATTAPGENEHDAHAATEATTKIDPLKPGALLSLFAQAARKQASDVQPAPAPTTEAERPLSPFAAAFLAAFRDENALA